MNSICPPRKNWVQSAQKAAEKLSREITAAMQTLAMQGGHFAVVLKPLAEGNAHGLETLEFQVAINPGSPLREFGKGCLWW